MIAVAYYYRRRGRQLGFAQGAALWDCWPGVVALLRNWNTTTHRLGLYPLLNVADLPAYSDRGQDYGYQSRGQAACKAVEQSYAWEKQMCASHYHGCTAERRRCNDD